MKITWVKTGKWIRRLFPDFVWHVPEATQAVYLTFDDGPVPEVTPWVLDLLAAHGIKATFFCIGDNIRKHPDIFERILAEGHAVGNHTFHHLNGWKTDTAAYISNIEACDAIIGTFLPNGTPLFRPPYGKITRRQKKWALQQGKQIIMWDILTADFDTTVTPEQCLHNATHKVEGGSILIFHDSVKAWKNLEYALPPALDRIKAKGLGFAKWDF